MNTSTRTLGRIYNRVRAAGVQSWMSNCSIRILGLCVILASSLVVSSCRTPSVDIDPEFLRFTDSFRIPGGVQNPPNTDKAVRFFLEEIGPRGAEFLLGKLDESEEDKLYSLKLLSYYAQPPSRYSDSDPGLPWGNRYKVHEKEKCEELIRKGLQTRKHILLTHSSKDDTGLISSWIRKGFVELAGVVKAVGLSSTMLKTLRSDPALGVRAEVVWFFHECFDELPLELKEKVIQEMIRTCATEPDPEYAFKAGNLCADKAGLSVVPFLLSDLMDQGLPKSRIGNILAVISSQARASKDKLWLQVLLFLISEVESGGKLAAFQLEQLILEDAHQEIPEVSSETPLDKLSQSWTAWWKANSSYLCWDKHEERFTVNKEAKKAGSSVDSATGEFLSEEEYKKVQSKEKELKSVLEKTFKQRCGAKKK